MRVVAFSLVGLLCLSTSLQAVEIAESQVQTPVPSTAEAVNTPPPPPSIQTLPASKPTAQIRTVAATNSERNTLTAEQVAKQKIQQDARAKALVKDQEVRLQQLEKANLEALAQNQELQLKNDSLGVQVQVLQSERSAQMFLYGATTLAVGVLLGFLLASYIYTKRRRQW